MNIIVVSSDLLRTRSFTVSRSQLAMAGLVLLLVLSSVMLGLQYLTLRHAANIQSPYLRSLLLSHQAEEAEQVKSYLEQNLNAMAVRLGQMQAQMMRLDALGDRLASVAGLNPREFQLETPPARGGATSTVSQQDMTLGDFVSQMGQLSARLEAGTDRLNVLDALLLDDRVKRKLVPDLPPVATGFYSSNFGWRIDPFNGKNAYHEGVDFTAAPGTPVLAAGSGVVVYADHHPQYGNMVEIDHGNDLVTRYAHAAKLVAQVGQVVLKGQKIAEVGSTGRSTGPHLHFEVRFKGVAQNPARFIKAPS